MEKRSLSTKVNPPTLGFQPLGIKKPLKPKRNGLETSWNPKTARKLHRKRFEHYGNGLETFRGRFGGVSVPIPFPNGNGRLTGVSVLQRMPQKYFEGTSLISPDDFSFRLFVMLKGNVMRVAKVIA
nr:hypothetical protein [Tanacetum cinerariifolium]